MKRQLIRGALIIAFLFLVGVMLSLQAVLALTSCPAGTEEVLIGLEDFEVVSGGENNLAGWGAPKFNGQNYGGGDDGSFAMVVEQPCNNAEMKNAEILISKQEFFIPLRISLRHLDGAADDRFSVFVNDVLAGRYDDAGNEESWFTSTFSTGAGENKDFKIKISANGNFWELCNEYGQVAVSEISLVGCRNLYPKIKEIIIKPQYELLERADLDYSEVFPLEPFVFLNIEGNPNEQNFLVNYTLGGFDSSGNRIIFEEKTKTCGKECKIYFPKEKVKQDMLLFAEARASHLNSPETPEEFGERAYQNTPYFNLKMIYLKAMNVVDGVDLVSNKPIALRGWVQLESYVRTSPLGEAIEDYIDIAREVSFDAYIDNNKIKTIIKPEVKRYVDVEVLKKKIADGVDAEETMKRLVEYKHAEETVNFVGIFPPKDKTGNLDLRIKANPDNAFQEFSYEDNEGSIIKNLKSMKKEEFRIFGSILSFAQKNNLSNNADVADKARAKETAEKSKDFVLRAFPLDPQKTTTVVLNNFPTIKISADGMNEILDYNQDSKEARDEAFEELQRVADLLNFDVYYGVVRRDVLNYQGKSGISGLTRPSKYKKIVLIQEYADYYALAHELGHLFTKSYNGGEQRECDDETEDIGLLSYEGWCMEQDTGEPCKEGIFSIRRTKGENINIWYDRDPVTGCFNIFDAPNGQIIIGLTPGAAGIRLPDIMTSTNHEPWPTNNPTYKELMDYILN